MKRVGFVYDRLLDKEFIKQTIQKASKHKTRRRTVRKVLAHIDEYTDRIYEMLASEKIEMRPTHNKTIKERGKERLITVSPFYPNQILDYLLVESTKPLIRKSMYQYCVGNVDKRGIMYGKKVMERHINKYKYYMKLDIRHFYQNVCPETLIRLFSRKIKDLRFLNFMRQVISKQDLPIGCYYSQWFSNFYLCGLDHYIKERINCPFYIRYVDDMIFCANNKKVLLKAYHEAKRYIFNLGLEFKYRPTFREFVNFLGFVYRRCLIKLRHSIFYRLKQTIVKVRRHLCFSLAQRLISYFSWLKNLKSGYWFYKRQIYPTVKLGKLKIIMSNGGI